VTFYIPRGYSCVNARLSRVPQVAVFHRTLWLMQILMLFCPPSSHPLSSKRKGLRQYKDISNRYSGYDWQPQTVVYPYQPPQRKRLSAHNRHCQLRGQKEEAKSREEAQITWESVAKLEGVNQGVRRRPCPVLRNYGDEGHGDERLLVLTTSHLCCVVDICDGTDLCESREKQVFHSKLL